MAARIVVRSLGYSDPETAYKTAPLPSAYWTNVVMLVAGSV
jgi:hypothetical protein